MAKSVERKLALIRNLSFVLAWLLGVAVPIIFGQANTTQSQAEPQSENVDITTPVYEVASIKPNKSGSDTNNMTFSPNFSRFKVTNMTPYQILPFAFGVRPENQISGIPNWFKTERYDIDAKTDSSLAEQLQKFSPQQRSLVRRRMLQALLEDRFRLQFHRETKELPVYWLVVAKAGKLHEDEGDCGSLPNPVAPVQELGKAPAPVCGEFTGFNGHLEGQKLPVRGLVNYLSIVSGRLVVDKTGLTGKYDISLDWNPGEGQLEAPPEGPPGSMPAAAQPDAKGPSLFTALQEQLGLRLESKKGPVEVIVIDHVERPSEN